MCLLYSIFQHECAFETIVCTNFIFICMKNTVRMQRILLECSVTSLVCVCVCVISVLQRKHCVGLLSRLLHCNLYTLYIH